MVGLLRKLRRARRRRLPGGKRWLQVIRRSIQISVLLLLFAIPSLSLYDNLRNQRAEARIAARIDTRMIDGTVGRLSSHESLTQAVRGSVWTLKIGDFVLSDPLAAVDFASASRDVIDVFLLTALIPILLTILLGRVFCGWICPADLLFELGSKLRQLAGIERDVSFSRRLKYVLLILGVLAGFLFGVQVFAEMYPPRIVSGELYLFVTFGVLGGGAWFMLLVTTFEIFVSKRFWCRYVCPGGALYSLLGRFRLVRLKLKEKRCTGCEKCIPVCEFGLDPMRGEIGQECNNCGLCVRACAPKALVWRLEAPKPRKGLEVLQ